MIEDNDEDDDNDFPTDLEIARSREKLIAHDLYKSLSGYRLSLDEAKNKLKLARRYVLAITELVEELDK